MDDPLDMDRVHPDWVRHAFEVLARQARAAGEDTSALDTLAQLPDDALADILGENDISAAAREGLKALIGSDLSLGRCQLSPSLAAHVTVVVHCPNETALLCGMADFGGEIVRLLRSPLKRHLGDQFTHDEMRLALAWRRRDADGRRSGLDPRGARMRTLAHGQAMLARWAARALPGDIARTVMLVLPMHAATMHAAPAAAPFSPDIRDIGDALTDDILRALALS